MAVRQVYAAIFEPEDFTSMARANEEVMGSRGDRGAEMVERWADTMDNILGRPRRREPLELRRQIQWGIGSRANPDGSITLSAQSAHYATMAGERLLNARDEDLRDPTYRETQLVRYTASRFGRIYGDMVQPRDPDLSDSLRVLDRALRENIDLPRLISESDLELSFPEINYLYDRHPLYQAATQALTGALGERLGMGPEDLGYLLRRTPAADRFEVLAAAMIERDIQQRHLPDGSARILPEDHVAALKTRIVQELETSFTQFEKLAFAGWNTREVGDEVGAEAATRLAAHLERARDHVVTEQRGYNQVASIVAAVESKLSTGDADHWSGQLHEATLPAGMLGYAGTDRALTFDRETVIDVLANADTTEPPTPEVRAAVDAVAAQAVHLCNSSTPSVTSTDPASQAFGDQLRQDFLDRHRGDLFAALGYPDPPQGTTSEHRQTATAQVTAALTTKAGQQLGMAPHQVAAELLTTSPHERFAKAAALSLGIQGRAADSGQWTSATTDLAARIRTTYANAEQADHTGQTKRRPWGRDAGRALSQVLTRAIDKARRPVNKASASADQALQAQVAAATAGQAPPGTQAANGAASSTSPAHLTEAGRSGDGIKGRG
jgi:hypothetical protein